MTKAKNESSRTKVSIQYAKAIKDIEILLPIVSKNEQYKLINMLSELKDIKEQNEKTYEYKKLIEGGY